MEGLWFEALPSPLGADAVRLARDAERLAPLASLGVQRVLVPEVKDGDYATVDPAVFARRVHDVTGLPTTVAVDTVAQPASELAATIHRRSGRGVDGLLLVGGQDSRRRYPGPGVTAALATHAGHHACGVVTIPTRRRAYLDEPDRLQAKHEAGARFSISQILFEAETPIALARDLAIRGKKAVPTYWTLAPVVAPRDLRFMQRLGAHVPQTLVKGFERCSDDGTRRRASIAHAVNVARQLAQAHEDEDLGPFGFCVSHVMTKNVEAAFDLTRALQEEFGA